MDDVGSIPARGTQAHISEGDPLKVWRVAHSVAKFHDFPSGPYNRHGVSDLVDCTPLYDMSSDHTTYRHPAPHWDAKLQRIAPHERCGFDSHEALDRWFAGWTGPLAACGFRAWVYEVPDEYVRVGAHGQALFDHARAELIETYELETSE